MGGGGGHGLKIRVHMSYHVQILYQYNQPVDSFYLGAVLLLQVVIVTFSPKYMIPL